MHIVDVHACVSVFVSVCAVCVCVFVCWNVARIVEGTMLLANHVSTAYCIWSDNRSFSNLVLQSRIVSSIQFLIFSILIVDLNIQRYEVHPVDEGT